MVQESASTTKLGWTRVIKPLEIFVSLSMNSKRELDYAFIHLLHSQTWGKMES